MVLSSMGGRRLGAKEFGQDAAADVLLILPATLIIILGPSVI